MLSHETGKVGADRFCTEACTVQGFGLYPEDKEIHRRVLTREII